MLCDRKNYFILCTLIGCTLFSFDPGYIQKEINIIPAIGMAFFFIAALIALPISFRKRTPVFQTHSLIFSIIIISTIFSLAIFSTLISSYYVQEAAGVDAQALTLPVGMIGISALIFCIALLPLLLIKYLSKNIKYRERNIPPSFLTYILMLLISIYGIWLLFTIVTLIISNYIEESKEDLLSLNIASASIFFVISIITIYVVDIIFCTYSNLKNKKES